MKSAHRKWMRQVTGAIAAIWALVAIGLSVFVLVYSPSGPQLPVRTSLIAGVAIVHAMSPEAAAAGVEDGDHLIRVAGQPAIEVELQRQPVSEASARPLGLLETQRIRPPIEAFAGAAAGLGPFPLPIVPDRVSQAWLFSPGAGGRPTLPAVAVQQHAIGVFERWLSLLKRADAHGLDAVSGDDASFDDALALRSAMMAFRAAFLTDPDLGARVRALIDGTDLDRPTRRLLHALVNLYDGPDSRYLNFYGPAGQISTLSLVDVIKESRDPDLWRGRSAFIGQSELYEPHNDAFITVYSRPDGVKISGVEIAATAFANLLDGRLLDPSPYWLSAIAGFGLVIGLLAGLLPALWAVLACLALSGLYLAGAAVAFAGSGIWLPTTTPLLAELPLGLFAGLFMHYRRARRARENLSKAIRYYLPDKIAEGFATPRSLL